RREEGSRIASAEIRAVPSLGSLVVRSYFILAALGRKSKKGTARKTCPYFSKKWRSSTGGCSARSPDSASVLRRHGLAGFAAKRFLEFRHVTDHAVYAPASWGMG